MDLVWADPTRLQQVLVNLIENAVKFTAQGQVTLRTYNDTDCRLRVEVSDTGIGIAPELLPKLFAPFQQGESTVTRNYRGLGLGLNIAKSLIEMHDGSVEAASDGTGRGATFVLTLPVVEPASVQPDTRRPAASMSPAR